MLKKHLYKNLNGSKTALEAAKPARPVREGQKHGTNKCVSKGRFANTSVYRGSREVGKGLKRVQNPSKLAIEWTRFPGSELKSGLENLRSSGDRVGGRKNSNRV